ncbi:MAG TPA: sigma-54-dependent Fis family transcriptional regulator [Nitrospirae bacterium]|nr:sigma-54-dependent Fis family transcriptional regulator [Nitrospirota bacterium]
MSRAGQKGYLQEPLIIKVFSVSPDKKGGIENNFQVTIFETRQYEKGQRRSIKILKKSEFKVLVAEDDAIVRDVIVKFLSEEGYSVVVAEDGHAAIKLLRLEEIKLVLTDLRMPGADGMDVLRAAIRMNPKIAVVLLTAYGTLDTALEAMKEGAYDYIVKPFVMQQLLLAVRNAYNMMNLIEENENLSGQLKETYRDLEHAKTSGNSMGNVVMPDPGEMIEKLRELNVIDADEARSLKEKTPPPDVDEKIKKYSSLVNGLKSE